MNAQQTETLFQRMGGINAVNAAVDIFYEKVNQDNRISHFFRHIDMNRQSGKFKVFMACAFGAPIQYGGRSMREAHAHMNLTEEHFDAVSGHLIDTLVGLQVDQSLIDEIIVVSTRTKNEVLGISE